MDISEPLRLLVHVAWYTHVSVRQLGCAIGMTIVSIQQGMFKCLSCGEPFSQCAPFSKPSLGLISLGSLQKGRASERQIVTKEGDYFLLTSLTSLGLVKREKLQKETWRIIHSFIHPPTSESLDHRTTIGCDASLRILYWLSKTLEPLAGGTWCGHSERHVIYQCVYFGSSLTLWVRNPWDSNFAGIISSCFGCIENKCTPPVLLTRKCLIKSSNFLKIPQKLWKGFSYFQMIWTIWTAFGHRPCRLAFDQIGDADSWPVQLSMWHTSKSRYVIWSHARLCCDMLILCDLHSFTMYDFKQSLKIHTWDDRRLANFTSWWV